VEIEYHNGGLILSLDLGHTCFEIDRFAITVPNEHSAMRPMFDAVRTQTVGLSSRSGEAFGGLGRRPRAWKQGWGLRDADNPKEPTLPIVPTTALN
jgi:hypothetical protein